MKKLFIAILIIFSVAGIYAQDSVKKDTTWKFGGLFTLTLSQTGFSNWAAGGENNYSANTRLGLFANYEKGKSLWENNLDLAYGIAEQGTQGLRKTDDLIELNTKYGYKANKKWYYSAVLNARTQFDEGFKYSDNDTVDDLRTSEFLAPLYVNIALGMDYKPNKYASVFLSPVNVKNIYVNDTKYALRYSIDSAQNLRTDVGAIVKVKYERAFFENMSFLTKLDLFANYLEFSNLEDIDVNWEIVFAFNVFKVLSVNINTHLIWDKDVKYVEDNGDLGNPRVQFKEIIGAGIAYKF